MTLDKADMDLDARKPTIPNQRAMHTLKLTTESWQILARRMLSPSQARVTRTKRWSRSSKAASYRKNTATSCSRSGRRETFVLHIFPTSPAILHGFALFRYIECE